MTVADELLADLGAHQAAWDLKSAAAVLAAAEDLPAERRDVELHRAAAHPVVWLVIKLPITGFPGTDLDEDAGWAAMTTMTRRELVTLQQAGIDPRLLDGHLQLVEIIGSRIGVWPAAEWTAAVSASIQGLVKAQDRGRERGKELRVASTVAGARRREATPAGWMLRHPTDHYFSQARATMTDPSVLAYLDQQIAAFGPSYRALAEMDWSAEEADADLVVELQISDQIPSGWKTPVPGTVIEAHCGGAAAGSELCLRLVADPDGTFNGTLLSVLAGERWRVCGRRLGDGTVLAADGTRRVSAM